jgi:alpha-N-arabinofuranosidase
MAGINPYADSNTIPQVDATSQAQVLPKELHPKTLTSTSVAINPRIYATQETVSDKLYSGFIEHLGRGIYGGIVDNPAAPSPADLLEKQDGEGIKQGRLGWRKDVMKIIAKNGELETPILRWPGGNFVSNYHWQDGIGPIEKRPKRIELAWLSTESNMFGTDEFIDYARYVNGRGIRIRLTIAQSTRRRTLPLPQHGHRNLRGSPVMA